MSIIDSTDDTREDVMLRLRLSNRSTAVPGRFRTADVHLSRTQQDLARTFKEECMIGKTMLDGKPILYIGAIARGTLFAKRVKEELGSTEYREVYIDKFTLNGKVVELEAWADQFKVPIHARTTIMAREERIRQELEWQFHERRAARLAREAMGTMGAAVPHGSVATMATAAGHDHVAHPPDATAGRGDEAKAAAAAASKALGDAGAASVQAAKEFGPQVYEAVLGVFEGLQYLVAVPFEWIFDILRLDVLSYGQKSAQLARALDLLANAGSVDTEDNSSAAGSADTEDNSSAAGLIKELALRAINREKSASARNKRKLKAATQLQQKLESNENYNEAAKGYKYAKGGDSSRYKAALYRFKVVAGRDYPKDADGATVEKLKTIVKDFIDNLTKTMKTGVYGYTYLDGKPQPESFESLEQIRASIETVESLLKDTTKSAIVNAIDKQLKKLAPPTANNAGLVGPFATAACALASDPTGCGCGTGGNAEMSSDDDDSDSDGA